MTESGIGNTKCCQCNSEASGKSTGTLKPWWFECEAALLPPQEDLPEGGSVRKRFEHLITTEEKTSGARVLYSPVDKIRWLPRIAETVENAQAKLKDPETGNYAYVRSYKGGPFTR